ncbi:capsid cement protein [Microbulbifer epialgicus]|uniref:Capsid cement protein n=1 Tax=Microbulbifer epialgicus TaxID=393907 RepID=A0ABV4P5V5_9GAMM
MYKTGALLDYTNNTGAAIASGQVVAIGTVVSVAHDNIAVGEGGVIAVEGVFTLPKVSGAVIGQGQTLTWDVSTGAFDDSEATAATGDITGATAFAVEAVGNGATSLAVKFTGVPGTVKV